VARTGSSMPLSAERLLTVRIAGLDISKEIKGCKFPLSVVGKHFFLNICDMLMASALGGARPVENNSQQGEIIL
jgi:hypothetical protein